MKNFFAKKQQQLRSKLSEHGNSSSGTQQTVHGDPTAAPAKATHPKEQIEGSSERFVKAVKEAVADVADKVQRNTTIPNLHVQYRSIPEFRQQRESLCKATSLLARSVPDMLESTASADLVRHYTSTTKRGSNGVAHHLNSLCNEAGRICEEHSAAQNVLAIRALTSTDLIKVSQAVVNVHSILPTALDFLDDHGETAAKRKDAKEAHREFLSAGYNSIEKELAELTAQVDELFPFS